MSPQQAGENDARESRSREVAGAVFGSAADGAGAVLRRHVFAAADLELALTRIAHEIGERTHGADDVVLVGLYTRGVALARRLAPAIASFEAVEPTLGALDVAFYRDDIGLRPVAPLGPTEVPDVSGKVVVLVDDVLFTGRTARAALDALLELGRPRAVQLAVLVDRGHRELPLRADYVGKNLPTRSTEDVRVRYAGGAGDDRVALCGGPVPGDQPR